MSAQNTIAKLRKSDFILRQLLHDLAVQADANRVRAIRAEERKCLRCGFKPCR